MDTIYEKVALKVNNLKLPNRRFLKLILVRNALKSLRN